MTVRKKSEEKQADQDPTTDQATPETNEPARLIYCGPSIAKLGLVHATVYLGGYPKHIEKHQVKCPAIKHMFVPVERLSETLEAIQTAGAAPNIWVNEILSYAKGGAE